jgi:hypothetical protein
MHHKTLQMRLLRWWVLLPGVDNSRSPGAIGATSNPGIPLAIAAPLLLSPGFQPVHHRPGPVIKMEERGAESRQLYR